MFLPAVEAGASLLDRAVFRDDLQTQNVGSVSEDFEVDIGWGVGVFCGVIHSKSRAVAVT